MGNLKASCRHHERQEKIIASYQSVGDNNNIILYLPTTCLTSMYPQTEVNDHPVSLALNQNVEYLSRCWFLDPDYLLK